MSSSGTSSKSLKINTKIRQALRQVWLRSPQRYAVIKLSRKGPNQHLCATCGNLFGIKDIQVDHFPAVGKLPLLPNGLYDWGLFLDRLLLGNQRVVCRPCHKEITKKQKALK